ncbi:MAG: hypothetical protein GY822_23870 [Deltaproteobacteria bacterium]|nr:hypothetical protein [Deltaproteobacteria bacterium]
MAKTANGFGTTHFGIAEVRSVFDGCEECGSEGPLFHFEATPFVVMFMLPVLPLKYCHVMRFCAVCGAHLEVPLKRWRQMTREALLQESEVIQVGDAPAVAASLRRLMDFDDEKVWQQASTWAGENQSTRQSALVQSVIGGGYFRLGGFAKAVQHLRQSLERRADASVRVLMVDALLRQGAVREAWREVRPYLQDKNETLLQLARQVVARADSLDEQGQTALLEEAHRMGIFELTQLPLLQEESFHPTPTPKSRKWMPYATWPLFMVLLGFGMLFASFWVGQNHEIMVISGVQSAYDVVVGKRNLHLEPLSVTKVYLPQGEHDIYIRRNGQESASTVEIRSSLFSRLFEDHLDVINPDRSALLSEKESVYSTVRIGGGESRLRVGELHYRFSNADFLFGAPPSSILLEGEGEVVRRTVMQHIPVQPDLVVKMLQDQVSKSAAQQWLKRQLDWNPHDERQWQVALQELHINELTQLAKSSPYGRLLLANSRKGKAALDEKKRLQHNVQNSHATGEDYYMLANATKDRREREALLQKAAHAQAPSAFALRDLALIAAKEGRVALAMKEVVAAAQEAPASRSIHRLHLSIAALAGAKADVFAAYEHLQALEPLHVGHLLQLIAFNGGKERKTLQASRAFVNRSKKAFGPVVAEHHHRVLTGAAAYFAGRLDLFQEEVASVPGWSVDAAFAKGDLQEVYQAVQNASVDEIALLALYLGALQQKDATLVKQSKARLQALYPQTASWLDRDISPSIEEIRAAPGGLSIYAARLLSVGVVFDDPEIRDDTHRYLAEAERFFVFRMSPQHLFEPYIASEALRSASSIREENVIEK